MPTVKLIFALLLGVVSIGNAWAEHRHHRHHKHLGVVIAPYWGPRLYTPYPYYFPPYYPPVVVERPVPQVYIEQSAPPAPVAAAPANYWYYCAAAGGYYPYVKECPGGWQQVLPQPPGAN